MEKKNYLTQEGLEKLKKELDYLENTKRKEISQSLKKAISFGDLSENAAYREAKDAQAFLQGRISELRNLINSAEIVTNQKKDIVGVGSKITLLFEKEEIIFQIIGNTESDPLNGKISLSAPLGKALLGKREGDIVNVESPGGIIKYKILKIE
ncbi:MAG: transcription elongation factor GreA [Patescibacteria group bacterium]|nr:transcription elongation factor GreA [Patescibacteria group bacterium]MBU1877265.1 transcription elongation factor GreA [Patescibacteria group bacterium]